MMHPSLPTPVEGIFETHLNVQDLGRSVEFYRDVIGLAPCRVIPERRVAFLWIGVPGNAMLGLWETGTSPLRQRLHFAFRTSLDDLLRAPSLLREKGVEPLDFFNQPAVEPSVFPWMPAASIFFRDPDDHSIEYLAMIPGREPEEGRVVSYAEWMRRGPAA